MRRTLLTILCGDRAKPPHPIVRAEQSDHDGPIEYIKAMIEYARDDARQVYLRVTAALAVAVLVLTQLPYERVRALATLPKDVFFVGLALLVVSAVLNHSYLQQVHHARQDLARCLINADAEWAQELGPVAWERWLFVLNLGDVFLVTGLACVAIVVAVVFT